MAKKKKTLPFLLQNKKANFNYVIEDTLEAGLSLTGSEVKSLRAKLGSLVEAYLVFKGDEVFLQNAHIPEYTNGGYANHSPLRLRKILLHRVEIDDLYSQTKEKGVSLVPMKIYLKNRKIKLLIGVGKGKNKGDKRSKVKEKEANKLIKKHI